MSTPDQQTTGPYLDEYVSFDPPTTRVAYGESPTGRLRFVHNASHIGRPYRLQQQWRIVETRQDTASRASQEFVTDEWRDVPCVEEGSDA